jgi:hypothetical protein
MLFFVTGLETLQILGIERSPDGSTIYLSRITSLDFVSVSISGFSTKRLTSTLNDITHYCCNVEIKKIIQSWFHNGQPSLENTFDRIFPHHNTLNNIN